jgi:predicted dehydrogenase
MQKQQLNWGIIGCGDVTELKSGPAFNLIPNSKLYAVMRRNAEKAADYAKRHDVPVWYSSAEELINDPQVNAIYVATPPSTHEEYTIASLKAGKPVYVEKPVALSATSCRIMAAAAEKYKVKLSVAHYRRALPYFNKIKALINEMGEIRFANISFYQQSVSPIIAQSEDNWRVNPAVSGGGLFHDLAPHHIDLLNWFFGNPISINGYTNNQADIGLADDIVAALLTYPNFPITGIWSFSSNRIEDRCEIVGAHGHLSFAFHGNEITFTKKRYYGEVHLYPS